MSEAGITIEIQPTEDAAGHPDPVKFTKALLSTLNQRHGRAGISRHDPPRKGARHRRHSPQVHPPELGRMLCQPD